MKRTVLGGIVLCGAVAALFLVLYIRYPHTAASGGSLLAAVIQNEFRVFKAWQEQGAFQRNLSEGMEGRDVRILQSFFAWHQSEYTLDGVTGYYGPLTRAAVLRYQAEHELPQTGVIDEETRAHVNDTFFSHVCPQHGADEPLPYDVVVARTHSVPKGYIPPGLEKVTEVPAQSVTCLESEAHKALIALHAAARDDGHMLQVTSGYRRPEIQQLILDYWLAMEGNGAYSEVALPGFSEHQLGTAVDFTGASIDFAPVADAFHGSPEWKWLVEHAEEYGFVMSYPEGTTAETGYGYEPWHWRYVGEEQEATLTKGH